VPYVYVGLLFLGCGHRVNAPEVFRQFDPETGVQAALLCCPTCSFIIQIVEPADDWYQIFYQIFNVGLRQPGGGVIPNES
jgi:hypothetical protein